MTSFIYVAIKYGVNKTKYSDKQRYQIHKQNASLNIKNIYNIITFNSKQESNKVFAYGIERIVQQTHAYNMNK